MEQRPFKCEKCGFTPRNTPVSGVWYCQKCGHRMRITQTRPHRVKRYSQKPKVTKVSRDQVYNQMYNQFTSEKPNDLGYKEPYLKPDITPIIPKRRDKIRLFYKK
ncbi:MAG: hypothetical protein ACXACU_04530 [Candidatus Hodarchaeales archaeon]|jgi:ribosomal protein L37AE/L43A